MKKYIFLWVLIFGLKCFSQDTDEPVVVKFDISKDSRNEREFVVNGSPYLKEKYQLGLIITGESIKELPMRYNAYNDSFQVLDENNKKSPVLKSPNVQVKLDGKTYHLLTYKVTVKDKALYYLPRTETLKGNVNKGFFNKLSDGNTVLYSKIIKRIPKFKVQDHGYTPFTATTFLTLKHYYIKRKYRPATRIQLSKKEVLFALNDNYNKVRAYMKKNKLKAKTVEEVVQIISYYDTLD